jgi:adenosylhomocysteine nucleosidase
MENKVIGIMGAMPEEISGIIGLLSGRHDVELGGRIYHVGMIGHVKTVVVFSRWGKVAAATTVSTLILKFNITELIFTGVAGAISPELSIGDVVVGRYLIQHDMDARPLINRFEIPLLGITRFACEENRIAMAQEIASVLLREENLEALIRKTELIPFNIQAPRVFIGDIASGDKFFSSHEDKLTLLAQLPSTLCVEMEGAAVAQVCYEYKIPFTVFRTISDVADESAPVDFPSFIRNISSRYSVEIIRLYFNRL